MATASAVAYRHPSQSTGLVSRLLSTAVKLVFWLLLALLFSIVIEWIGMTFWWPDAGVEHSRHLLVQEQAYLNSDFRQSLLAADTVGYAQRVVELGRILLFEWTGLEVLMHWLEASPSPADPRWLQGLRQVYWPVADYISAAIVISQVFAMRLAVLTLAMPAFALLGLVALVDGLVQRDLRRWGGGRESAFIYHHAKDGLWPSLLLAWVIYLSLPFSVHPNVVILPFAGLFALAMTLMASTFKKYL